MKTVLITGAEGFIGKNLRVTLQCRNDVRILSCDVQDEPSAIGNLLGQADFVFHLAGVNRPEHADEFVKGNARLTEMICSHLAAGIGRKTPLLLSSSIQAAMANPYGASKKASEDTVFEYGRKTGAQVFVYRLPNVFGKWCRPNYNSAVATFCHNIANGLPIQVNDPGAVMKLVYIDDVVSSFIGQLDATGPSPVDFLQVQPVHTVRLGDIAELIGSFRDSREQLNVPDLADLFVKKLHATYLSYLPVDGFGYPLNMKVDERGSFTEFIKTTDRGQVSVNIAKPGITKGNHWHHTKNEKFLVVAGQGVIRFRQIGSEKIIEYRVSGEKLEVVDIPPGYTHNISNSGQGDMVTIMWCNEIYDQDKPDTYYEKVERNI